MATMALAVAQLISPVDSKVGLTLADLDGAHQTLMSCAEGDSDGGEPMWCSDPSSPMCSPAAPQGPAPDLSDHSAPAALLASEGSTLAFVWVPWPSPGEQTTPPTSDRARFERPPRG